MSPSTDRQTRYWRAVKVRATAIDSDGCSVVNRLYGRMKSPSLLCCLQHDLEYHDAKTVEGEPVTRRQADQRLRRCIQEWSKLGRWSPLAFARWLGVRAGGWWPWRKYRARV